MKVVAIFVATLLAVCSANAQASGDATQPAPAIRCNEIKRADSTTPAVPLRLVKGTKLIVTETDDAINQGEHKHAVVTAEHTITKTSKTEIRFDTHNILNSSSDGYYGRRGDEWQDFPVGDPPLQGESGEPTNIYVETPVFNGTVHVLARHDRAAGELWRWVSTDPVEIDLKLEDGSKVKIRADYSKELILFNGIKSSGEGFSLTDFSFMPVWMRDTLEGPGKSEEIIQVLTSVEQPAAPLRITQGTKFIVKQRGDIQKEGVRRHAEETHEYTITSMSKTLIKYDTHNTPNSSSDSDFSVAPDEKDLQSTIVADTSAPASKDSAEAETDIEVDTPIYKGTLHVLHEHETDKETWNSVHPIEIALPLADGSRVRVRADYTKELVTATAPEKANPQGFGFYDVKVNLEGFDLHDFQAVPLWAHAWMLDVEIIQVLTGVQQPSRTKPHR